MIREKVKIKNKLGLHARASSSLVQLAETFKSKITIEKDDQYADGKSILGILMLAAGLGTELSLAIEGEDEKEAFLAIKKLIDDKFNEE